eukprot:TRINITY_DN8877_c0_g1_i1.p1 TRINITY_DN8877_c0_g1~~TRINITY_DN8877_c0_g1_i1.p1  ORF type:complete len:253 (-),score=41.70 TRINITY_DN8877_c0_g1_i1:340-1098(-)
MSSWFEYYPKNAMATHRLFCFAYSGGTPSALFHSWSKNLPKNVEVVGVCMPGRGRRMLEKPYFNMKDLIEDLGRHIVPLLDKPFFVYGHSLGAMIAYELIQYLVQRNLPLPARFFPAACSAPSESTGKIPEGAIPHKLKSYDQMIALLRSYSGTPDEILENRELMEVILPYIQADFSISEEYAHKHTALLKVPVTYLCAAEDALVSPERQNWKAHTQGDYQQIDFQAGHFFISTHTDDLLRHLTRELRAVVG